MESRHRGMVEMVSTVQTPFRLVRGARVGRVTRNPDRRVPRVQTGREGDGLQNIVVRSVGLVPPGPTPTSRVETTTQRGTDQGPPGVPPSVRTYPLEVRGRYRSSHYLPSK